MDPTVGETREIALSGKLSDSAEGYERMLMYFADDEVEAGERYLLVRRKLIAYFEGRRISPAEDFADEVLDRVAKKIAAGEEIEDINRYIYGIARFVRLESYRRRASESLDEINAAGDGFRGQMPEALRVKPDELGDDEQSLMRRCLGKCMDNLSANNRDLLLEYYAADEEKVTNVRHRRTLAQRLGKSAGTLQKQVCLLRQRLSRCADDCVRAG